VSPRPYQIGERRKRATDATRSRIVQAAHALLSDRNAQAFTIDAVAERADVARMTVYYQFKSKQKLLEALFDDFGRRANLTELRKAVTDPEPLRGLHQLIEIFCRFWDAEQTILRRLNAFAGFDPEVDRAMRERGSWRRDALAAIVTRLHPRRGFDDLIDVLHVLTSFETYDALAARGRSRKKIATALRATAMAMVSCWDS
jgi:AcrR family transcriptional regulator